MNDHDCTKCVRVLVQAVEVCTFWLSCLYDMTQARMLKPVTKMKVGSNGVDDTFAQRECRNPVCDHSKSMELFYVFTKVNCSSSQISH